MFHRLVAVVLLASCCSVFASAQTVPGTGCPLPGATPLLGAPVTTTTPNVIFPGYLPCVGNTGWMVIGVPGPPVPLVSPPFCSPGPCTTNCNGPYFTFFMASQGRINISIPSLPPGLPFCLHGVCVVPGPPACIIASESWTMTTI